MNTSSTRPRGRLATLLSLVAVVVSLGALGVAGLAWQRAGSGREAAGPGPGALPSGSVTSGPASAPSSPDSSTSGSTGEPATGTPPLPTGAASYTLSYQDESLTLTMNGSSSRLVDFDQPLVNADSSQLDAYFATDARSPRLTFETDAVAVAKSPAATPAECARAIQLSPVPKQVTPSQDLVICAVTNGVGATAAPQRSKLVRLVVKTVRDDGTVVLDATAWEIPH